MSKKPNAPAPLPVICREPEAVTLDDFLDELGNSENHEILDGFVSGGQATANGFPTDFSRKCDEMDNSNNSGALRAPPDVSLGALPSFETVDGTTEPPPPPEPVAPQMSLPMSDPTDTAPLVAVALSTVDVNHRDARYELEDDQGVERDEIAMQVENLFFSINRLSRVSGMSRTAIVESLDAMLGVFLGTDGSEADHRSIWLTLQDVGKMIAAARAVRSRVSDVTGIDAQTLARALIDWTNYGREPAVKLVAVDPPRSHKSRAAAPASTPSPLSVPPKTQPGTPAAKQGRGRPGDSPEVKAQKERDRKAEQERKRLEAQEAAEARAREAAAKKRAKLLADLAEVEKIAGPPPKGKKSK